MDLLQSIEAIEKSFDHIESIKNKMFDVISIPLSANRVGFENPLANSIYRSIGGKPLGTVGKDFKFTQPKFLLENFVNSLADQNADLSKLEYRELKGGSKIQLSAPIQPMSFKTVKGFDDVLETRVNLQTGFDGLTVTSMYLSTYRLVCSNGMKAWKTDFSVSFKNTQNNLGKVSLMAEDVVKVLNKAQDYKSLLNYLVNRKITTKEYNEYFTKVTKLSPAEYSEMTKQSQTKFDAINEAIAIEQKEAGATAWSLLNGITRYTNHSVKLSKKTTKDDYLFVDTGATMNENAQKFAYQMFAK